MDQPNNMQAVIEAALRGAAPVKLFDSPWLAKVYLPGSPDKAGTIVDVDLGAMQPAPLRKRGSVTVFDAASFNQVLADNADAGNVAIYIDRNPERPSVVAVLNGNGRTGPGWSDFRVRIEFRRTPQWEKWRAIDGKMLPQATFAEFIEDNLADIADPPGATMLEIVTYLQATRTVNFRSALRLPSGAIQFQNIEDIDAKVGAGLIAVPETFTLGVAPLFGLPPYKVPARFRYRIQDGKLALGVRLQRVEDVMGQLVEDVIAKIERGANVSVMDGLPPAA
jgi:uncharacterized protein YfdQ (DUF2303 family)